MSEACLQWLKQVQKRPKDPIYSTARCTLKKKRRKKKNGLYRVNYWLLLKFYGPPWDPFMLHDLKSILLSLGPATNWPFYSYVLNCQAFDLE